MREFEKIILGIDPSYTASGYGILSIKSGKALLHDCGYVSLKPTEHLSQRIGSFHHFFNQKIQQWHVTDLALETPFLGKNAQNFLKLGYLRGILYLLTDTYKVTLHEFSPREVKQAVTGFGGAQKDQVARMIYHLFPYLNVQKKHDVTDALAITLCAVWKSKTKNLR